MGSEERTGSPPLFVEPQLATLVERPPEGDAWLHEVKLDGYRMALRIDAGGATLVSRRGNEWTRDFPEIAAAARALPARSAYLDGELCVASPDGRTSFQDLQSALGGGPRRGLAFFAFDLLHLDGRDLSRLPLQARKRALEGLLAGTSDPRLRYCTHFDGRGAEVLAHGCRLGFEGIVSKRRDKPYRGGRSALWLKTKCTRRQELVVGGFTPSEGRDHAIGALLVGRYEAGKLRFAGKVGTGYTRASAKALRERLRPLEQRECPFAEKPKGWLAREGKWVRPELVAEVEFLEWTRDGRVRHPSFGGLRADKAAGEVVRERPARAAVPSARRAARPKGDRADVAGISISKPARLLWPELGLTKLDLARYWERIGEAAVGHAAGRPLTLVRCDGPAGEACQYLRHAKAWGPGALRRVRIAEKTKTGEYLVADTVAALVALAQMDVVEVHTWNSRAEHVEQPDRIVIDLDPGPDVSWREVIAAARLVRSMLHAVGLESWVKTTGGRGLHVVAPVRPERTWSECLASSRGLAAAIEREAPRRFTTRYAKAGRERQILVDYLRNNRTNTSVMAFSPRARPGAPVSVPIAWDELSARLDPLKLTVVSVPRRVARLKADPWAGYFESPQRLTKAMLRAVLAL